jgi:predicted Fe-Mo cluster-binding NifX family protein
VVAVAADGNTASTQVSAQLGRSPYFLLFDDQARLIEADPNPYKDNGNAGVPAVNLLAGNGVKVLVAQGFGGLERHRSGDR